MVEVAQRLETMGADYVAVACNTAHYYYDGIVQAVHIPVLNIMVETVRAVRHAEPGVSRVGLMATQGTVASGVFENCFSRQGVELMVPEPADQDRLNELIYDRVKANKPYDAGVLCDVGRRLCQRGCEVVVVGCTELSVVYDNLDCKPPWLVDSLDVLADRCVEVALTWPALVASE